ncbi:gluconate 2-dehydrogenase subunit 3 family protein [Sphaerisporangium sp. NPDC088356]|uniref:gluconate 2-dehydrogenase subunit 3 family protein n=1 Tax=Sphaerisporangium sp. NPDC088356 TaxID=3154871 RepID=UPI00344538B6
MADWPVVPPPADGDSDERLFFDDHEWDTIEAATARVIPTDHDPGAREAGAVRFIDRYLSGIDAVYAAADGSGFLRLSGKLADAWRARIADLRETYRQGVRDLDAIARERFGADFVSLGDPEQDAVLEQVSGRPRPAPVGLTGEDGNLTIQVYAFDDGLSFFDALVAHTRQGFYGDPVYGGNRDRVGWRVIGFPGPESLKDTIDGTYSVREYYVQDYDWGRLIPHLRGVGRT